MFLHEEHQDVTTNRPKEQNFLRLKGSNMKMTILAVLLYLTPLLGKAQQQQALSLEEALKGPEKITSIIGGTHSKPFTTSKH